MVSRGAESQSSGTHVAPSFALTFEFGLIFPLPFGVFVLIFGGLLAREPFIRHMWLYFAPTFEVCLSSSPAVGARVLLRRFSEFDQLHKLVKSSFSAKLNKSKVPFFPFIFVISKREIEKSPPFFCIVLSAS